MTDALALGAGSESRMSMGIAVIGGLTFGSALTLYIIPALYTLTAPESRGQGAAAAESGSET